MAEEDLSDLDHGNFERIACLVFCAITPTFLLTRFWSRILAKQLGPDDWSALAACVSTEQLMIYIYIMELILD
jgi:hypothetical protein